MNNMNGRHTKYILMSVLILVGIGTLMVFSSTALTSMRNSGSGFHYLLKHLFTVSVGIAVMVVMSRVDYNKVRPLVPVLMAIAAVLLLLVFIPGLGISANGARRWIRLWPTTITFQPSELVKLVMVISLADYMDKNIHRMKDYRYGICIPVGVMIGFQAIIMYQPDFGAVMSLTMLLICLLFLGGVRMNHIITLILLSLPAVYLLIKFSPYRLKRWTCFLDPWKEPLGCGYQLIQSLIAFNNGKILGLGIGNSKQKLDFLPEAHNDFIFSIIGEECGLMVSICVIGVFVWLFVTGIKVASRTHDPFSYFLALGLSLMIGMQTIVNVAVSTGLLPTKGLPLPFISYGGSALVINMAAAGILMNISRQDEAKRTFSDSAYVRFS